MTHLKNFARFWYDFIVGDDWRLALAAVVLVPGTAFITQHGVNAWWLLPLGVSVLLGLSIGLAARIARSDERERLR